jgi:hypothetical protein
MALNGDRPNISKIFWQIKQNMINAVCGRQFISAKCIDEIFTEERTQLAANELHCPRSQDFERIDLANELQKNYRKVFTILIWMGHEDDTFTFRRHRSTDAQLPLNESMASKLVPGYASSFVTEQWTVLPHHFSSSGGSYCYQHITDSHTILPFIKEISKGDANGKFSDVSMVTIPTSNQEFFPSHVRLYFQSS